MPLVTGTRLLTLVPLTQLLLAHTLLTNPQVLLTHPLILILSQSMRVALPAQDAFAAPSHASALAAVVLAFLSVADLAAAWGLPEDVGRLYWGGQAPIRVWFWMLVCGWVYLVKGESGWGAEGRNGLVFSVGFAEMATWFWIFIVLRDEKRAAAEKAQLDKRRQEYDAM